MMTRQERIELAIMAGNADAVEMFEGMTDEQYETWAWSGYEAQLKAKADAPRSRPRVYRNY